ncbi:double-strand break repair protein AddB [Ancylobacter lacus]|uniref:double-strand break repair protein AddB n=1 Tax=Ancylobacter lacus TaxID=2579970 RepID=UPI001BD04F7A|nr:double-strand break repair protein AddB [Ancylobacter lacus]MBS7540455.1 double-strand break repair protein AddB [Ancylobacter lacus]
MRPDLPRVGTIPASVPFLDRLADALLDGELVHGFAPRHDPLALASATVFLPTRRAGRLFADALVRRGPAGVALLPRIVPLGDVDEDTLAFADAFPDPPEPVPETTRRLALAHLVRRWRLALRAGDDRAAVASGPGAEIGLADALAGLIDEMSAQDVDWARLDTLVPGEHDAYWDVALDFLKIARTAWPALLAAMGRADAGARRDQLIDAEAARLTRLGVAAGPVIAAGSTGSMPRTARLLNAVARLPLGCLVLPGLDTDLDDAAWAALTDPAHPCPSHPQFGLAGLLARLGITRREVEVLAPPAEHGRALLLSEALRPAGTTEAWAGLEKKTDIAAGFDAALSGLTVVVADDAREEALAIAIALREALEAPGRTAALVTPDRDLARRVAAELLRFGVAIDDSAGVPLSETPAGRFARLVAETAQQRLAPVPLAALLRHPLAGFGTAREAHAAAADALELMVLRGPRPATGSAGLLAATRGFAPEAFHRSDVRASLPRAAQEAALGLAERIAAAFGPLEALAGPERPFAELVAAHRATLLAVAGVPEAVAPLDDAFAALADGAEWAAPMSLFDYAEALPKLLAAIPVRAPLAAARLRILGPLEARLVAVDRVVLAGLVEDGWPAAVRTDPWLSRPMRAALGLDAPERRIGLAAHDFAQLCGAREVILSRAGKLGGAPTVPSRFLQRLAAVAGERRWSAAVARGDRLRRLAGRLDTAPRLPAIERPAPKPPVELRPTRLSVTEIETWLRDPYSIYARHVLGLRPLDRLDEEPGGAERGNAVHQALGTFAAAYPEALPEAAEVLLAQMGRAAFADLAIYPAEHAVWWARFERLIPRFIAWERERRADRPRIVAETAGRIELAGTRGPFTLTGRADRIEIGRGGSLAILDFKTGTVPTARQTHASYSPQLPLEAAMAKANGFRNVPPWPASELVYVKLGAGAVPLEAKSAVDAREGLGAAALAEQALERLRELVLAFENEAQGYLALRRPMFRNRFGDYDHLARVKEWSVSGEAAAE